MFPAHVGRRWRAVALTSAAVLAACSSPGTSTPFPAKPSGSALPPVASASNAPAASTLTGGGLDAVRAATVQIQAEGSFVDPEFGQVLNAAGRGSGFVIDPDGIVVTNNHVVTGASILKVWVGGEPDPRNAKVLAVSECSDLAIIDVDGGGFPTLSWRDDPIAAGLDVYAAGYPLGDPEYTLTRGIVSKERTSGETYWASVDRVLEHDASINPGSSGGPLVDATGRVIGVNYRGDRATDRFFAISRLEAGAVLDELRMGRDVTSIGVNGEAVSDGAGLTGIWVYSVESGSPADEAGVTGGDVITKLGGIVLATDGTMADYCDVLRSHEPGATLDLEIVRFATQEVLEGQLNGRPLTTSFSFAQELGEETGSEDADTYTEFVTVRDDTGAIMMEVPAEWDDVSGVAWSEDDETVGVAVVASPDRAAWYDDWDVPGAFFGASRVLAATSPVDYLADGADWSDACTDGGIQEYSDSLYTGAYHLWTDCGAADSTFIDLAATPADASLLLVVQVTAVDRDDLDALDRILATFQVTGDI